MWPTTLTTKALLSILAVMALTCLGLGVWLYVQTQGKHSAQEALKNERDAHANTRELHRLAALSAQAKATEQRTKYERAAEVANERHQAILEQAKKDTAAAKALAARYLRSGNAACRLRLPTDMPAPNFAGAGASEDTPSANGVPQPKLRPLESVLATCDVDAKTIDIFQRWCRDNDCEVVE